MCVLWLNELPENQIGWSENAKLNCFLIVLRSLMRFVLHVNNTIVESAFIFRLRGMCGLVFALTKLSHLMVLDTRRQKSTHTLLMQSQTNKL